MNITTEPKFKTLEALSNHVDAHPPVGGEDWDQIEQWTIETENYLNRPAPEDLDDQVVAWAKENGFIKTRSRSYETGWSHTEGHSFLTFRIMRHDQGWWVIVESKIDGVNLGSITRLEDLVSIYRALRSMEWNGSAEEGIVG